MTLQINVITTIAKCIKYEGNTEYRCYLNKNGNSIFTFENVDEETVKKTINSLFIKKQLWISWRFFKLFLNN